MATVVNGERIENEAIRREAERMRPEFERAFADVPPAEREPRLQQWAEENAIEQVLLAQAAKADARPIPPEQIDEVLKDVMHHHAAPETPADKEALRADIDLHLRIRRLTEEAAKDLPAVADEAVLAYYEGHHREFTVPERVHAAHIVKHVTPHTPPEVADAALQEARKELDAGADFAAVAAKYADCPDNGGDLGWFARGQMVEEFEHTVFGLQPGQVSPIFATRFGFHIVKLIDRKPAGPCDLKEVEGSIRERLANEARGAAIEKLLDGLRAAAKIEEVV